MKRSTKNIIKTTVLVIVSLIIMAVVIGVIVNFVNADNSGNFDWIFPSGENGVLVLGDFSYDNGDSLCLSPGTSVLKVNVGENYSSRIVLSDEAEEFDILVDDKFYSFPGVVDVNVAFGLRQVENKLYIEMPFDMDSILRTMYPSAESVEILTAVDFSKPFFELEITSGEETYVFPIVCDFNGTDVKIILDNKELLF